MEKRPNTFVVGFPRSGTTSLHYYMSQHPEIFVTKEKELHYFANDILEDFLKDNKTKRDRQILTKSRFLHHFKNVHTEKAIVNFSPNAILSPSSAKKIYEFNKEAKIVIMLRNPIDLIHSLHTLFHEHHLYSYKSILSALRNTDKNRAKFLKLSSWTKYADLIKRYYDVFPKENIKVLLFKDFKNNTQSVFEELAQFLTLSVYPEINYEVLNSSRKIKYKNLFKVFKLMDNVQAKYDKKNFLNNKLVRGIAANYMKIISTSYSKEPLPRNIKKELVKITYPEVLKTETLINKFSYESNKINLLDYWGYKDQ